MQHSIMKNKNFSYHQLFLMILYWLIEDIENTFYEVRRIEVTSYECNGVLNHQQLDCLVNNLLRPTMKITSKSSITSYLWWEPIIDQSFPLKNCQ